MAANGRFISADDHVQEHPEVWTQRLSRAKWGDRIPHLKALENGTQAWVVDGQRISLSGVAVAGALMPDRTQEPSRWDDVPKMAYDPNERLRAMDADRVDYSVLYPTVAGVAGETFGKLTDPEFEPRVRPGIQRLADRGVGRNQPAVYSPMHRAAFSRGSGGRRNQARRRQRPQRRYLPGNSHGAA